MSVLLPFAHPGLKRVMLPEDFAAGDRLSFRLGEKHEDLVHEAGNAAPGDDGVSPDRLQ